MLEPRTPVCERSSPKRRILPGNLLPVHAPPDISVRRDRPQNDIGEQKAEGQAKGIVELEAPDDGGQAADVHEDAGHPPERQVDEHAPEGGRGVVAGVEAHAELAVLQAVDGDEVFGGVVDERPGAGAAGVRVDADGQPEAAHRQRHDDEQEDHQEGRAVEVERRHHQRGADHEGHQGDQHRREVHPGCGVEFPPRAREERGAEVAVLQEPPDPHDENVDFSKPEGDDGVAEDCFVVLCWPFDGAALAVRGLRTASLFVFSHLGVVLEADQRRP